MGHWRIDLHTYLQTCNSFGYLVDFADTMSTFGDRVLNVSLPKIGEKSLFTRDLEDALRNGGVDFVVHSLKDLPTALPTGMAVGAVLEREDARDALVLRENLKGYTIATLPKGSVIGKFANLCAATSYQLTVPSSQQAPPHCGAQHRFVACTRI